MTHPTPRYGCDPNRVKVFGDGLEKGIVDEPNTFTIETKNAGAGGLGLAIEGPSEALMQCEDNKDGTATGKEDYFVACKLRRKILKGILVVDLSKSLLIN